MPFFRSTHVNKRQKWQLPSFLPVHKCVGFVGTGDCLFYYISLVVLLLGWGGVSVNHLGAV